MIKDNNKSKPYHLKVLPLMISLSLFALLIGYFSFNLGFSKGYNQGYNLAQGQIASQDTESNPISKQEPQQILVPSDDLPNELYIALADLWHTLNEQSLVKPTIERAKPALLKALISSLSDPYSEWLTPEESKALNQSLSSHFSGMGFDSLVQNNKRFISNILEGSAAYKADLRIGDQIVGVNKVQIQGSQDLFESALKLNDKHIELLIQRKGAKTFTLTLDPFPYQEKNISFESYDPTTFYIDINSFSHDTPKEFDLALSAFKNSGCKNLVLDLRNNLGGYIESGIHIISRLAKNKEIAFSYTNEDGSNAAPILRTTDQWCDVPLAILVNNQTFSTAELVADSLKVYQNALVVGSQTYGKGTQQGLFTGSDGTLRLSLSYFSALVDAPIHNVGVKPTHAVEIDYDNYLEDSVLISAVRFLRDGLSP